LTIRLSAPPVDCSTELEVVADEPAEPPVVLPAEAEAAEEEEELPSAMLEAMLEAEDMADVADMAALSDMDIDMEEDMALLPLLSGAGVELAAAEDSQVAAVGRLFTPWPPQSEFAKSRVSGVGC
jgi:hypothetical protein